MPACIDQTGQSVQINSIPQRIVSLVPSQTELLYNLGLDETVAGITKFCIHPGHWFRNKKRVGGTKSVDASAIRLLKPDLIIANKEENLKEQVEQLAADYPVWTSDISNLQQALDMITALGAITGTETAAATIINKITSGFVALEAAHTKIKTAYLIWQEPYMSIGGDTFIHDMLQRAGFENIFGDRSRYPVVSIEEIKEKNCQLLLLSSEPFPFSEKHQAILQPQLASTKIILADGEMFSWYGSRLLLAPAYFKSLLTDYY
jgi:ABC-type Fe3+-hydroxamate transport system substrate-binding protein